MRVDTVRLLSRGDRVEDGEYHVLSRFRSVVNMTDGRKLVSLVGPGLGAGPTNLVLSRLDPASIRFLSVTGSSILLDGTPVAADGAESYDSAMEANGSPAALSRGLRALGAMLRASAPRESLAFLIDARRTARLRPGFEREYARHMRACANDIFFGDTLRGAARMRGCGLGLTPSGDDFIVGLLLALHLVERVTDRPLAGERRALLSAGASGCVLSGAFVDLASEGRAFESMKRLIASLLGASILETDEATRRVLMIGATSGADTAVGLCLGSTRALAGWPRRRRRPGSARPYAPEPRGALRPASREESPWS